jgi:hypothetical protein
VVRCAVHSTQFGERQLETGRQFLRCARRTQRTSLRPVEVVSGRAVRRLHLHDLALRRGQIVRELGQRPIDRLRTQHAVAVVGIRLLLGAGRQAGQAVEGIVGVAARCR